MRKVTTMLRRIKNKFNSFFSFFFEPNLWTWKPRCW